MSPRARVLAALSGKRVSPVPVGAVTQSATLEQMDTLAARWPEAHCDAVLMARLAGGARTVLGFDVVRLPFDQTIEAELLGAPVDYGDALSNASIRSHPLSVGDPPPAIPDLTAGRAGAVLAALSLLRGSDAAVIGGVVGPFTLVCQLAGIQPVLMAAVRRPDSLRPYLDLAARLGVEYAQLQIQAGADAICVEDMAASLELTSPRIYESLVLPAQRQLIAAISAPVILHICGNNTRILDLLTSAGAAALSLDAATDLSAAVALRRCAVIGGVAPVDVLLNGTVEDVRRASQACLSAGVHLLAPGCGLVPRTPFENLRELVRAARQ